MSEKTIPITKVQIGHVVGPGGSTIKSIQEKTGAKVEIDSSGPAVKISADDDAKVAAAVAAVKEIIAKQENPDYEGAEGSRLRKEANALGDKRSKLFDEATAKRNAGDHDAANKLVAEAKKAGEDMESRHREAAAAIAKHNNEDKGKGEDFFDMHGLREEEAMEMLRSRVGVLEAKPTGHVTDFEVIPGAGNHSAPGAQKLKGAAESYFKEKGFSYEAVTAGSFLVKVPGKGEGEPPAKKPKREGEPPAKKPTAEANGKASDAQAKTTERKKKRDSDTTERKEKKKKEKKEEAQKSCCAVM